MLLLLLVMMMMGFDHSGGLDLGRSRRSRRLSGCRRGEVGLLLTGVEHHSRSDSSRGRVLLDRVHGGSGPRVLQVMMVVHVGGRKVLELLVVVRVMGSHG